MEKLKNIKAILAIIITIFTIMGTVYGGKKMYDNNVIKRYNTALIQDNNTKGIETLSKDNATEHKELSDNIKTMKSNIITLKTDLLVMKADVKNIKSNLESIDGKLMILLTSKKYKTGEIQVTVQK